MSNTILSEFAAAVKDPSLAVPASVTAWNSAAPERRFKVYRNNVSASLRGALASRFPATQAIVGDDFFHAMAQAFIDAHPPRSPLLLNYGDEFGDFVEHFTPASELAYLPDVIRLEAARSRAYHAADQAPLDPGCLAAIAPEHLADVRFARHPSLGIIRSIHPIITIWAMNTGELELRPIERWQSEDALVLRPQMIVEVHRLPPGGASFLLALAQGQSLAQAMDMAMADSDAFDLTANLTGALQSGVFSAIL
ncbi:DNA-binding domain-containing protein [Rhizobium sp.]|jgi:hypothetical protein|uniref:HvfC/BufC N-terminal domain-containing protein n=1 Tax=Rhizobium sp. TaxID=391 RepID=UPI000E851AC9|nr:DUF2063 domain-containing protein [Rhizobium sp.]